jgi:DHA1 family multidrug resistance protein-like MFS transporter
MVGLVSAITGIANLIGSPMLGRLGDKIGQRKILIFPLILCAIAFIPQIFATTITELLFGRFFLGLFIGGMLPSLNVLVKKMTPKDLQATAFGLNSSARFLGNLIGPIFGSFVATTFQIQDVFYFTIAFLLMNAVMIIFTHRFEVASHKV